MNSNNLQQWWEHTYRRHQLQAHNNLDTTELHYALLEHNQLGGSIGIGTGTLPTTELESSVTDFDYGNFSLINPYDLDAVAGGGGGGGDSENAISSLTLLLLAVSYGLVVFGGVVGNSTLVLTLCSASSVRLRNPLLLAVCIADLLVTGISAPVTLLNLAMNRRTRSLPLVLCKVIHYIQVMPVAASTISFFMLSLDRYATVKHPRLAQLRQRRYLHVSLALISWLASAAISTPFLFAYKIIAKSVIIKGVGAGSTNASTTPNPISISCTSDLGANAMFMSFIIFHTIAVFILPGVGVLLNHYGVRRKLCALSLTARAAHGELPLPMPILRRQTHMVIVTGCANAQQAACGGPTTVDDTSNGNGNGNGNDNGNGGGPMAVSPGDIQMHTLQPRSGSALEPGSFRSSNPISPRAMREIRAHSQRQRIHRAGRGPATPGIPLPQTSTLRSRRHLANMLIASAIIFIVCWAPHVFCIFYKNFGYKQYCSKSSVYFSLLLGYFYSAISPVIYWALNHNSLRQSPCAPIIRLRSMQNFLRSRFRTHTVPPPPSSTNEAALGAFNPKLIKLTPKQYRAQASSHYLY
ncbi:alpha-2A adrenergic receptor [Drosophila madeirensis]|uniref:Alpha-2A adrenergic receptor n=1 Tax=Drosophila madeirensis TaxID=30013 RepID=A0AAU9FCQ9_DROMD